jgi:hypothetical protein
VAEPPFDDIDSLGREIDRLWAKVATSSVQSFDAPLPPMASEGPGKQLAWETVNILKRQHRKEQDHWEEAIEAKERALQMLRERAAILENENSSLKGRLQADETRLLQEGTKVHAQLEAALAAFEAERRQRDDQQNALRAMLDQMRQRLAAEDARWKIEQRQWEKKEQQYLLDVHELQALASRHQKEQGQTSDQAQRLSESLKEAKNALEKTLAELLRERQVRQQSEQERERASKKVDELETHLTSLSKLWDEERAQWRELWDRERSTWETQRQEFAAWEERLRKEREAWHAELETKEKDQLKFTEQMTNALRETSDLSMKVGAMLRGQRSAIASMTPRARRVALVVLLLAASAPMAWRHFTRLHFKPVASQKIALASPTSMAYDGSLLWLAGWDGRLEGFDPQNLETAVRYVAAPFASPRHGPGQDRRLARLARTGAHCRGIRRSITLVLRRLKPHALSAWRGRGVDARFPS